MVYIVIIVILVYIYCSYENNKTPTNTYQNYNKVSEGMSKYDMSDECLSFSDYILNNMNFDFESDEEINVFKKECSSLYLSLSLELLTEWNEYNVIRDYTLAYINKKLETTNSRESYDIYMAILKKGLEKNEKNSIFYKTFCERVGIECEHKILMMMPIKYFLFVSSKIDN